MWQRESLAVVANQTAALASRVWEPGPPLWTGLARYEWKNMRCKKTWSVYPCPSFPPPYNTAVLGDVMTSTYSERALILHPSSSFPSGNEAKVILGQRCLSFLISPKSLWKNSAPLCPLLYISFPIPKGQFPLFPMISQSTDLQVMNVKTKLS